MRCTCNKSRSLRRHSSSYHITVTFQSPNLTKKDIRTSDRINPDGTQGFHPNFVVSHSDDLPEQALLMLRGGQFTKLEEDQVIISLPKPPQANSYTSRIRENEYPLNANEQL